MSEKEVTAEILSVNFIDVNVVMRFAGNNENHTVTLRIDDTENYNLLQQFRKILKLDSAKDTTTYPLDQWNVANKADYDKGGYDKL